MIAGSGTKIDKELEIKVFKYFYYFSAFASCRLHPWNGVRGTNSRQRDNQFFHPGIGSG